MEAIPMQRINSAAIIEQLRTTFSRLVIPQTLVSDNAPYFKSEESRNFFRMNGITFLTSPVFHPSSNGLVERAVQTVKQGLKKVKDGSINTRLCRILLNYRRTPIASLGKSPSELMFDRNIRSRLDFIKPEPETTTRKPFRLEERIWFKSYGVEKGWKEGIITKMLGKRLFLIKTSTGELIKRHLNQLQRNLMNSSDTFDFNSSIIPDSVITPTNKQEIKVTGNNFNQAPSTPVPTEVTPTADVQESPAVEPVKVHEPSTPIVEPPVLRRSTRVRRQPDRLQL